MRHLELVQGSAGWLAARLGKITASRIVDATSYLKKGGESAARRDYREDLVAERLTGRSEDHYVSQEMVFGTENEPFARVEYEIETGAMVEQVGFVLHPTLDFCGGSPDGLVGDDGLIEIKCGKTTTHLRWMVAGVVPEDHLDQIQWNLLCTERKWADFVSFDPRLPDGLRLFVVRVMRDEDRIAAMEAEVVKFNGEVDAVIAELKSRIKERTAPPIDTRSEFDQLMALLDVQELIP